ncbi:MAG: death-on-curing family protein [Microgenomates group bacterium Gr01-1014_7]|nr:MAG: death-on-curing family protein [Microgenomates group bacterium Gr01-1014_7]
MKTSKVQYLTVVQVLFIHDQMVKRFGGSFGVRDLGLIESAVARPEASFDGQDLYTNIFDKAAALLQSLLKNHPFVDGNNSIYLWSKFPNG